ncbi:protein tyrosine kinase domain-containing protein [Ditylenchus destructor]|nr:protein tyrosine kinase domain-containing protein [Ditylenchus destructor]
MENKANVKKEQSTDDNPDEKDATIPSRNISDYYHGLLPAEDMQSLLKENGDFCVRTTEIVSGSDRTKCLSVRWDDKIRHFVIIQTPAKMWTLDMLSENSPQFVSIEGLIDFHTQCKQPFSSYQCRLYSPVPRQVWEFRHSQIELRKRLGEGAFGEVYSGYVNKDKKRYKAAIKTIKCAHVTKAKIEESMMEARLMRRLSHPNIVRFYGVAAEEEPLMVLMELVKGGSLDNYLEEKNDSIGMDERIKMCSNVSDGLEYLHKKGILHRDMAARNCLYDEQNVKISDFGMSRLAKEYAMVKHERAPVCWMAPEVWITKKYTTPSDVWATGVLFWEIFHNGKEPYDGWPFGKVRTEVVKANYRLSFPDSIPKEMKELVARIWIGDPLKRITAEELARALRKLLTRKIPNFPLKENDVEDKDEETKLPPTSAAMINDADTSKRESRRDTDIIEIAQPAKTPAKAPNRQPFEKGMKSSELKSSGKCKTKGASRVSICQQVAVQPELPKQNRRQSSMEKSKEAKVDPQTNALLKNKFTPEDASERSQRTLKPKKHRNKASVGKPSNKMRKESSVARNQVQIKKTKKRRERRLGSVSMSNRSSRGGKDKKH